MSRRSLADRAVRVARAVAVMLGAGLPVGLAAQSGNVAVNCPACGNGTTVTPALVVLATEFAPGPLRYTVQASQNANFTGTLEVDTTFSTTATTVAVQPNRALTGNARLWYRAMVTDSRGVSASSVFGPFTLPPWVTLIGPPSVAGQPERTVQPRFVWRSPGISEPPGPWEYTLTITSRSGVPTVVHVGSDTSYVPGPTALEANAAYTWKVDVELRSGQSGTFPQSVSFTTEDTSLAVTSTQFYNPFPNPFPYVIGGDVLSAFTCLWFDLRARSDVHLDVYTYRGAHVRRLLPNAELAGQLDPGRYGRGRGGTNEQCDPRVRWDGRDDGGNDVPEGVYLIRFRADGIVTTRRVTFRGR